MDGKAENIIIISQLLAGFATVEGGRSRKRIVGWRRGQEMVFN